VLIPVFLPLETVKEASNTMKLMKEEMKNGKDQRPFCQAVLCY
jgi:hypothetical protein